MVDPPKLVDEDGDVLHQLLDGFVLPGDDGGHGHQYDQHAEEQYGKERV